MRLHLHISVCYLTESSVCSVIIIWKISLHNAKKYAIAGLREKKSRVRKETKEFAEKQELEFSDAPSMDESTEPEDLQQATDSVSGTGDEWELEEKEQEEDSEQGDIHV